MTPQSDGSVAIVRRQWQRGVAAGPAPAAGCGPLALDAGASIGARARVQVARGWVFPDQTTADRFLEHAIVNSSTSGDFPADWVSIEGGREVSGAIGEAIGGKGFKDRRNCSGSPRRPNALGARILAGHGDALRPARARWPDVSVPFIPSLGNGREEWLVEYTFGRDGPREIAFRRASTRDLGQAASTRR